MKAGLVPLAILPLVLAAARLPTYQQAQQASIYIPDTFIVEISSAATSKRGAASASPLATLQSSGISFHEIAEYNTPEIFVGASVRLTSPGDLARLANEQAVISIRPVIKVAQPQPVNATIVDLTLDNLPDTYSTHVMTGVDKIHAVGNFGAGVKIGIIDTGIDYTHPLLGGGFGPGFKVIGGYDFVGDNYNGQNLPMPDPNPLDECNGHGTHVAGIIGANPDNGFGISGVAFNASLASYRIFGCTGFTTDDIIVEALIRAYNDKMDILTLSLGGASGWTEGTASVVASRIQQQGRVLTVAAGNDGMEGAWYTSDPGAGIGVISVASVDNVATPVQNLTVQGAQHNPIPYLQPLPFNATGQYPVYATSSDTTNIDDACSPLPDDTPNLSSYVVLIHRGSCTFVQKLMNAAAKGATLALIYNSDQGSFSPIDVGSFKAVLISADDGKWLVQQSLTNPNLTISFPQSGAAFEMPNPDGGGLISEFSTIGPTFDMHLSPSLAAPGGNILSTFPLALGGYAVESGTSMATPFVAGAAALVFNAKGKTQQVAFNMQSLLQTTSATVASSHTDGTPLQTVAQQGAGLIQVDRAIAAETIVSPSQIALNDTAHFEPNHTISITNLGSKRVVYTLLHVPAETIQTVDGEGFPNLDPVGVPGAATISFSSTNITVGPGDTKHVVATIMPPPGPDATLPVYSGYIQVVSVTESFHVTYLGVASSLKTAQVLDTTDEFFGIPLPTVLTASGVPQTGPTNYTFMNIDFPVYLMRFLFGTAYLRFDLVDKDIVLPNNGSSSKVKTIGPLAEMVYLPRSSSDPFSGYTTIIFMGQYANGTRIDDGQYRALLRLLKVAGNPRMEEDYETWLSPQFGVVTPS